jgi:hypothetical protein
MTYAVLGTTKVKLSLGSRSTTSGEERLEQVLSSRDQTSSP